ncbi:adenylate/guanylate cyclase domain-containing protein [Gordonia sp. L191]|uniref:adenylate/guanylate cyclase domain-containing protein n=1 Tax=Gordonia TaxID=2053 RepID=UPI001AD6DBC6|nr:MULTISPECIES: adenylate/guanylate cyclase domain-containing protein [Gordonia]QTI68848.1 adenylate/guanylate cyclase domain-containing protein [Gordonia polyisoprenivorans]WHU47578.1 adenylate/guanylate cyclase domain-containing protein [Gordonia sp. L191]
MAPKRGRRDYGSILLGSASESGFKQRLRIQTLLTASIVVANLVGAIIAIALSSVGIPEPSVFQPDLWWVNFLALPLYVAGAFVIGIGWGTIVVVRDLRWAIRDRPPTERDARRARRAPWRLVSIQAILWIGAVIFFTLCYGIPHPELIPKTIFVVGLSGVVVVAISYLLIEFSLRPVAAELISAGYRRRKRSGVRSRAIVSWLVGSAIPVTGILLVVLFGAFRPETSKVDMFVGVAVLAVTALATGLILTLLSSLSIIGPIRSVRTALHRVEAGELDDVEVVVYDGTELGDLQAGFNLMVGGLREREHMRDLFGRHVGREVAEAALASDPELGGTEKVVAAVFVDVIGSTTLAAERSPVEVVEILNRFFGVIVAAVEENKGLVNKFEGDAVLAIFGAPIALSDCAGAALAAARTIATRLGEEVPELSAGIGVSHGPVVAGNVGAIQRFEYTVIGDPVNESARLSELAKRNPRHPLASGRAVEAARPAEREKWREAEHATLRGRTEQTVVYEAAGAGEPVSDAS